jgi:hypothetical protein
MTKVVHFCFSVLQLFWKCCWLTKWSQGYVSFILYRKKISLTDQSLSLVRPYQSPSNYPLLTSFIDLFWVCDSLSTAKMHFAEHSKVSLFSFTASLFFQLLWFAFVINLLNWSGEDVTVTVADYYYLLLVVCYPSSSSFIIFIFMSKLILLLLKGDRLRYVSSLGVTGSICSLLISGTWRI